MTYRDILVLLDTPEAGARYELAARLAARGGGRVTGVYLKTTLINPHNTVRIGFLPAEDLQRLIDENDEAQEEAATKAAAALSAAAIAAKADWDWRTLNGDTPDDLIAAARRADLTILPPPESAPPFNVNASAVEVGLDCGGPVLIAPEVAVGDIGRRVLVAWTGSRESARALRDALPLLADGAVIELRSVQAHPRPEAEADEVVAHLQSLGFRAALKVLAGADPMVATLLRREAAETRCDLMVLGLYGHTRVREFVLGGVSRSMLDAPGLPLLVSH